ncbi:MAG TPA: alpha-amylase family glycosyl hydrolase, partial [Methylomirabilota bacterium]|nr:alpha-amylase family glycosyl hydrolase [Methylomirabilota bacterium]
RVFDYIRSGGVVSSFGDAAVMEGPLGSEPSVAWIDGDGTPRTDWADASLPDPSQLSAGDAVWPADLQNQLLFRRRGSKLTDQPDRRGFVRGDFGDMRQLVVEYDAGVPGQERLRGKYGVRPVLSILIRIHQYLLARYDIDGFRVDTVKYVDPDAIEVFGNAMREFALSVGKKNFFIFGEIYDDEATIARFVGRNGGSGDGYGIDAALDFPLFYTLPAVAKGMTDVAAVQRVFAARRLHEQELLSSHGDAGRYFVSFLDNHDQHERIQHPDTPVDQVTLAATLLFALQGVPCVYYGTEQGLRGTVDAAGQADLTANESTREALWGKNPAFDVTHPMFRAIEALARLRQDEPPLVYGRMYFREVSGNGVDFGYSFGRGGIVAVSRILVDREVLIVANTGSTSFSGMVIVDRDLNPAARELRIAYSNQGTAGKVTVTVVPAARFHGDGRVSTAATAAVGVSLRASEVQILTAAG